MRPLSMCIRRSSIVLLLSSDASHAANPTVSYTSSPPTTFNPCIPSTPQSKHPVHPHYHHRRPYSSVQSSHTPPSPTCCSLYQYNILKWWEHYITGPPKLPQKRLGVWYGDNTYSFNAIFKRLIPLLKRMTVSKPGV